MMMMMKIYVWAHSQPGPVAHLTSYSVGIRGAFAAGKAVGA